MRFWIALIRIFVTDTVLSDLDFPCIKLVSATPRRLTDFLEALQISLLGYEHLHVVLDFLFYQFCQSYSRFELKISIIACVPAMSADFLKLYMFPCSGLKICMCVWMFWFDHSLLHYSCFCAWNFHIKVLCPQLLLDAPFDFRESL